MNGVQEAGRSNRPTRTSKKFQDLNVLELFLFFTIKSVLELSPKSEAEISRQEYCMSYYPPLKDRGGYQQTGIPVVSEYFFNISKAAYYIICHGMIRFRCCVFLIQAGMHAIISATGYIGRDRIPNDHTFFRH